MSFYTSLRFYRPTRPPVVTGPALADFIEAIHATGLVKASEQDYLKVKFGQSIDQDSRPSVREEPEHGGISRIVWITWDIEEDLAPQHMVGMLRSHDRPIYRAHVALGTVVEELTRALQTRRPDDGEENLCLWDLTLSLMPIHVGTLQSESVHVGWIGVSLSGQGYLWPWMPRDLTERAKSLPALKPLVEVCRRFWPVQPNAGADWSWGVSETG